MFECYLFTWMIEFWAVKEWERLLTFKSSANPSLSPTEEGRVVWTRQTLTVCGVINHEDGVQKVMQMRILLCLLEADEGGERLPAAQQQNKPLRKRRAEILWLKKGTIIIFFLLNLREIDLLRVIKEKFNSKKLIEKKKFSCFSHQSAAYGFESCCPLHFLLSTSMKKNGEFENVWGSTIRPAFLNPYSMKVLNANKLFKDPLQWNSYFLCF